MMEDNEEIDYDDAQIPIHAGFGAFDDDTVMEEPEVDDAENESTDELGRHCAVSAKIVGVKKRG